MNNSRLDAHSFYLPTNCTKNRGLNCNNNKHIVSNESYIPTNLVVIPLGKFKGKYDTRRFRCFRKLCHVSKFKSCQHCKYLPYTSSPLRNKDYCENIEIKDPTLKFKKNKFQNELDNIESILVWLMAGIMDDFGLEQNNRTKENVSDDYAIHLPLILKCSSAHQIENINIGKVVTSLLKITNKFRSLILVSSLRRNS